MSDALVCRAARAESLRVWGYSRLVVRWLVSPSRSNEPGRRGGWAPLLHRRRRSGKDMPNDMSRFMLLGPDVLAY